MAREFQLPREAAGLEIPELRGVPVFGVSQERGG